MEFNEVINVFFQVFDNIGLLWTWYISFGIVTVVGWMLADQKHLRILEKKIIRSLITFGFVWLMYFNYQSLIANYKVLESIRVELQTRIEIQEELRKSNQTSDIYFQTEDIVNQIKNSSLDTSLVSIIHWPIDIAIIVIIWLEPIANKFSRRKRDSSREKGAKNCSRG